MYIVQEDLLVLNRLKTILETFIETTAFKKGLKDKITTLPKRDLTTNSYRMNMNDNNYITNLRKRDLTYRMNMNKKNLKKQVNHN